MENAIRKKAAGKSSAKSASVRRREEEEKFRADEARRRAAFQARQAKLMRAEADALAAWIRAISWDYIDPATLDMVLEGEKIHVRASDGTDEEITLKEQLRRVFSKPRERME